ncbi:MAG: DUF134 domain-containing protein [bacterium]|nr:DUF134 domain-containing protein [bacterium]
MSRPPRCRYVNQLPGSTYFKPRGVPMSRLDEIVVTIDELEALRLADLDGLYQEQAARKMKVSRQTFGRIVSSARRKVAKALVEGAALKIDGGKFETSELRDFACVDCGHQWQLPFGTGRPQGCPECSSDHFHRTDGGRQDHQELIQLTGLATGAGQEGQRDRERSPGAD